MFKVVACVLLLCVLGGEGKSPLSPCQRASNRPSAPPGAFKPKCNPDGSYAKLQCHASSGYCWCSTKNGARVPGTSVRGKKPDCSKAPLTRCQILSKRPSTPGAYQPKCNPDGTYALVQCHASAGYCWCSTKNGARVPGTWVRGIPDCSKAHLSRCQRAAKSASKPGAFKPKCNADGSYAKIQCHASTGYCWCSTKYGSKIGGTTARGKPACAKGRPSYCEIRRNSASMSKYKGVYKPKCNADGSYAKIQCQASTGYCWCSNKYGARIGGTMARGTPACANGRPTSCEMKRNGASWSKKIGVFKPKCNADGTFAKVQCHASTGYCWCAKKTGAKIPGTSVRGKPKC